MTSVAFTVRAGRAAARIARAPRDWRRDRCVLGDERDPVPRLVVGDAVGDQELRAVQQLVRARRAGGIGRIGPGVELVAVVEAVVVTVEAGALT
jgi:hypothetical protein